MLVAFLFYSVILVFWGTTNSSLLLPSVPKPVLCQSLKGLGPFLVPYNFLFLVLSPWKSLADFPFWGVLRELTSAFWLFYLFRLSFWLFFFLSFFPSERNPFLLGWRFSQLFPLIVLCFEFPDVLPPLFMDGYSKPFGSLLRHWVLEKDTSVLHSLYFFGTPFELSQSHLNCVARPENLEPLAASRDPDPVLSIGLSLIL